MNYQHTVSVVFLPTYLPRAAVGTLLKSSSSSRHTLQIVASCCCCLFTHSCTHSTHHTITTPQTHHHHTTNRHQVDLPEGQLVISPLREQWLQRTGDLLADTFVDAKGIQPYRYCAALRCAALVNMQLVE